MLFCSQLQPPRPAKRPVNASAWHGNAGYMVADILHFIGAHRYVTIENINRSVWDILNELFETKLKFPRVLSELSLLHRRLPSMSGFASCLHLDFLYQFERAHLFAVGGCGDFECGGALLGLWCAAGIAHDGAEFGQQG